MDLELRTITADEVAAWLESIEIAFGERIDPGYRARTIPVIEPGRSLAVVDGGRYVGHSGIYTMEIGVPGGTLPVAGVTMVGVHPTHRRRGILTAMMQRLLDDAADHGEPIAALFASEASIYGRFGYGCASWHAQIRFDKRAVALRDRTTEPGEVRFEEVDDAAKICGGLYEALVPERPGLIRRTPAWWNKSMRYNETPKSGAPFFAVRRAPEGSDDGYVTYHVHGRWKDHLADHSVEVVELVAATPGAYRDLWEFVLGIDLATRVQITTAVDDPVLQLLTEARQAKALVADNLWVRLVDIAAALEGRRYSATLDTVLEVEDAFMPTNAGRWRLEASEDGARCTRTDLTPDLSLPTDALASLYLGGGRTSGLALAGRVHEHTPGALSRLHAAFGWPIAPHCPWDF